MFSRAEIRPPIIPTSAVCERSFFLGGFELYKRILRLLNDQRNDGFEIHELNDKDNQSLEVQQDSPDR